MAIEIATKLGSILFDEQDARIVSPYKWVTVRRKNTCYATAYVGNRTYVWLHRLIATPPKGMVVDHINGNGLDNRRTNLRVCEHRLNIAASRSRTGSSKYKGVTFDTSRGKWIAQIRIDYKHHYLGRYSSEEEAARAYDVAAVRAWGNFATLNFTRVEAEAW